MQIFKSILAVIVFIFLTGCGSTLIAYQPTPLDNVKDAADVLTELTKKLEHDDIIVEDNHMRWHGGDRVFFESINSVAIYKKKGSFYVYIFSSDKDMYLIWTEDRREAERYVNALETLRLASKKRKTEAVSSLNTSEATVGDQTSQKLRELQALRKDGLITEEEYEKKRKKLIEHL